MGIVGTNCMSDSDVVRAKWSSSLRKRSLVAAVDDTGDDGEGGDIASAHRLFVLLEVNSILWNELDVDGLEWAVEDFPIQSVRVCVMKDLVGGLSGSHSALQTCGVETIDRTMVSSFKSE